MRQFNLTENCQMVSETTEIRDDFTLPKECQLHFNALPLPGRQKMRPPWHQVTVSMVVAALELL